MKKYGKLLALLLSLALLLTLCACGGGSATSAGTEPEEEEDLFGSDTEDTGDSDAASLKGVAVAKDWDAGYVIDLPDGFRYDSGWECYSNNDGVQIWAIDMDLYEYDHNFEDARSMRAAEGEGKSVGLFRYWTAEATEFYGPTTHYFVSFEGRYADFYGCHVFVSVPEGQDIKLTQSQDIIDMLATIRREGETVGNQGTPPAAAAAPEATEEPVAETPEPTEEPVVETPEPTTAFSDLYFNYSGEECAAMSAFMNYGRYDADGDILVGTGIGSDGDTLLVSMELSRSGDFADVADYHILDNSIACYVTIKDGYVYYVRDWGAVCRVPVTGGDIDVLVPHESTYLQIRGEHLYYCDADSIFHRADLNGKNDEVVLDKEIYFPYLLDEDWLLYQDDADGETLHLLYIPDGEDVRMSDEIIYQTFLWNTDLYVAVLKDGSEVLAKIDLINPQITYDEQEGAFRIEFPMEYGERAINADISFTADGWICTDLENMTYVDDWENAANEDGAIEIFYPYSGPDWEVYWRFEDGYITGIYITNREGGGSQSIGYFE